MAPESAQESALPKMSSWQQVVPAHPGYLPHQPSPWPSASVSSGPKKENSEVRSTHLGSPRPSHGLGNQQSIQSKTLWKNHSLGHRSIKYSVCAKSGHYFCKVLLKHTHTHTKATGQWDFPDGTGDKNLPTSAGGTGSIPGTGRLHMTRSS